MQSPAHGYQGPPCWEICWPVSVLIRTQKHWNSEALDTEDSSLLLKHHLCLTSGKVLYLILFLPNWPSRFQIPCWFFHTFQTPLLYTVICSDSILSPPSLTTITPGDLIQSHGFKFHLHAINVQIYIFYSALSSERQTLMAYNIPQWMSKMAFQTLHSLSSNSSYSIPRWNGNPILLIAWAQNPSYP